MHAFNLVFRNQVISMCTLIRFRVELIIISDYNQCVPVIFWKQSISEVISLMNRESGSLVANFLQLDCSFNN